MLRRLPFLLLSLSLPALAAERLPDTAPLDESDDRAEMAERFPAPPMDHEAMQNVYLESPLEALHQTPTDATSAVEQQRHKDADIILRERLRQQMGELLAPAPQARETPPVQDLPPPTMPTQRL